MILIAADYSQLEARIAAFLSRDAAMLEVFRHDPSTPEGNLHVRTTSSVFGISPEEARNNLALYTAGKTLNFLTLYGGGADKVVAGLEKRAEEQPGLALRVPTEEEAREWLAAHRRTYPGYWEWVGRVIDESRARGYSLTVFGRPRFLPDLDSPRPDLRAEAERQAVNHCIQGTAADIAKMAMLQLRRNIPGIRILLQVHDEILIEHEDDSIVPMVCDIMTLEQPFRPYVDLVVDVGTGRNWWECHK